MSSTTPPSTSATATTAGDVVALTTTFTPPAKCTEQSLMFTMLSSPNYEIWANEPMPVSSSTVSECYPSEWMAAYRTANHSSIVPAMSPFICPLSWETVMTAPGNYVACCPPGFKRTDPSTTIDGYRPMYGGTCYSDLPSGSAVRVVQYNNKSVSATVTFSASTSGVGLYAHPMDGYALQAQKTIFVPTNSPSSTATSIGVEAKSGSSSKLSGGAIAGIVVGVIAGVALLVALLLFLLHRNRASKQTFRPPAEVLYNDSESKRELDSKETYEVHGDATNPIAEFESKTAPAELSSQVEAVELDARSQVESNEGRQDREGEA